MWYCQYCGEMFNEPEFESYCKEEFNGVSDLFPGSRTYGSIAHCPYCYSVNVDEFYCDEECEECSMYDKCTLDEKKLDIERSD